MATSLKVNRTAERLSQLPLDAARLAFSARVDKAYTLEGVEAEVAHDFNAELATELRERGIHIWETKD